jgi:hypothetical protein
MVKRLAVTALLGFALLPAASWAQVVVRIGPPPPIVERRHLSRGLCGSPATIAGMGRVMFGRRAAGTARRIRGRAG